MTPEEKLAWKAKWIETFANKPYRPSNGTEGMEFEARNCLNCIHEKFSHTQVHGDAQCDVLNNAYLNDDFSQWFYDEQAMPYCKCFKKWDWGSDDDESGLNIPPPVEPEDPMQMVMPFIIEETLKEKPVLS